MLDSINSNIADKIIYNIFILIFLHHVQRKLNIKSIQLHSIKTKNKIFKSIDIRLKEQRNQSPIHYKNPQKPRLQVRRVHQKNKRYTF